MLENCLVTALDNIAPGSDSMNDVTIQLKSVGAKIISSEVLNGRPMVVIQCNDKQVVQRNLAWNLFNVKRLTRAYGVIT